MRTRVSALLVALTLCTSSIALFASPAHADADNIDNHLCLDTGFGFYGVSDHVHITATTGTYHISTFGQASAWTYFGTGSYCNQTSTTAPCSMTVSLDVYKDGLYVASTATYANVGVHSVSTGNHSYGVAAGNYIVISYVKALFGSGCTSEADGSTYTNDFN